MAEPRDNKMCRLNRVYVQRSELYGGSVNAAELDGMGKDHSSARTEGKSRG